MKKRLLQALLGFVVCVFVVLQLSSESALPVLRHTPVADRRSLVELRGDHELQMNNASCRDGFYRYVTNPSIISFEQTTIMATRALVVHTKKEGNPYDTWHSNIAFTVTPSVGTLVHQPNKCSFLDIFARTSPWQRNTCQYSFWGGNTHAYGPEDPKLFILARKLYVLFGSRLQGTEAWCEDSRHQSIVFGQYLMPLDVTGGRVVPAGDPQLIDWTPPGQPERDIQKNFVPFDVGGRLHLAFELQPHTVLELGEANRVAAVTESTSHALTTLAARFHGPVHMRGNTAALRIAGSLVDATLAGDAYLGALHIQHPHGVYHHFLYVFEPDPPFTIRAVSCELPLRRRARAHLPAMMPSVAYVAGLALHGDPSDPTLVVTYGSGDAEARMLVGNLRALWTCDANI